MHVYLELELYIIKVAFSVSCTKHGNVTFLAFTGMAIQRVIPALLVSMSFSEQGRFQFQYLMFLCSIPMEKVHWECQTCGKVPCFYSQFRVRSSWNFCLLSSSQLIIFVLKFSHVVASRLEQIHLGCFIMMYSRLGFPGSGPMSPQSLYRFIFICYIFLLLKKKKRIMLVTDTLGSIVTYGSLIRREVLVYEQLSQIFLTKFTAFILVLQLY